MRFSESEIVEDILEHIRQAGGEFSEWHVGTTADSKWRIQNSREKQPPPDGTLHGQISKEHQREAHGKSPGQDSNVTPGDMPGRLDREAYTTYAAEEVVDRLKSLGLRPDRPAVPQPGKTVFVYHGSGGDGDRHLVSCYRKSGSRPELGFVGRGAVHPSRGSPLPTFVAATTLRAMGLTLPMLSQHPPSAAIPSVK